MLKNNKNFTKLWWQIIVLIFGVWSADLSATDVSQSLTKLDKYQTPVPYAGHRNWHVTQNLGVTGARGWVLGERGNSTASREILIKSVVPGSPADGILQPYDIIIGIGDKSFSSDARITFAKALTAAEGTAKNGKLELLRWRDGKTETVTIKLPVMGDYCNTLPVKCPKTAKILKDATAMLAERMPDGGFEGLQGALNTMLLYASEDPHYLDHVRRSAMAMGPNHKVSYAGHETWRWGYCNTFLAEYYLATGDKRVLPTIAEYCDKLAKGQCCPGTWGHRNVDNWIPPGYGSLNQSGLVCFVSMILGRQCGVPVDEKALKNSILFYGRYAGWGSVPYGDHPAGNGPTGNGKNGIAAVAFNILGAEAASRWFANLCASTNLIGFEGGHTGNFFNQTWSPIGASLAGNENYINFWERFNSYRDMCRIYGGGFMTQPWTHIREGDLGTGNYVRKGPMWTTGGYGLSYLGGTKRLAILGREKSVFGTDIPASLKPSLALYHDKKYKECIEKVAPLCNDSDQTTKSMAVQLKNISERNQKSIDLTLADMKKNLAVGDFYLVKAQLQGLEGFMSKDDPRLAEFYEVLKDPKNLEIIASRGNLYDRLFKGYTNEGLKGFSEYVPSPVNNSWTRSKISGLARSGKGFYQNKAKQWLAENPGIKKNINLTKPLKLTFKQPEVEVNFDVEDPSKIEDLILDWELKGQMNIELNDVVIYSETVGGKGGKYSILLKPITKELLKKGVNVLKVSSKDKSKKLMASCQLKAIEKM